MYVSRPISWSYFIFARPIGFVLFFSCIDFQGTLVMRSSLYDTGREGFGLSVFAPKCSRPSTNFFSRSLQWMRLKYIYFYIARVRSIELQALRSQTQSQLLWLFSSNEIMQLQQKIVMIQAFIAHLNENMHSFIYWSFLFPEGNNEKFPSFSVFRSLNSFALGSNQVGQTKQCI